MASTYAIELRLAGRRCVVVGGGDVAARKVQALATAGADVHVIAPQIDPSIRATPNVTCHDEAFASERLAGAVLVFACTDDPAVNRTVAACARAVGAWVNVADDPAACDFFVPASFERGDFRLTVSTGGASPQLAAVVRQRLESMYGPEYGILVDELRRARAIVRERVTDPAARRAVFATLCEECSITLLSSRGATAWREWFERIVAHRLGAEPPRAATGGSDTHG